MYFSIFKKSFVGTVLILSIFSIFLFSAPKKAEAQYVDLVQSIKELPSDFFSYTLAQIVLKKITAKTVNWINSGFKGNPSYITDPKQFFLDTADESASAFISGANLNALCAPFRAEVRLALVKNYLSETSGGNYSCTLGKIKDNYEAFIGDFRQGGWDGWFELTQNDQNNPYGAYAVAKQELSYRLNYVGEEKKNEITQGAGFLSFKKCKKEFVVTQDMLDGEVEQDPEQLKREGYKVGDCLKVDGAKETVTPGSIINGQLSKSLGASWDRLGAADEITEIIGALVGQLIERVVGGKDDGGLRGTSLPDSSGRTFTTDYLNEPSPGPAYTIPEPEEVEWVCETDDSGTMRCRLGNESPSARGAQCADTGNVYAGELRTAMNNVLIENPDIGSLPNIEAGGRVNARRFLALVETELISMGLNATDEVLNGNGNPSTGDIIAIWDDDDEFMERYDAIIGAADTIQQAPQTAFEGFVPLNCTSSGGGKDCGCRKMTGGSEEENSCTFQVGSYGNDSGAPSGEINPTSVVFEEGNGVGSWTQTAVLSSASVGNGEIRLPYDKAGVWPSSYLNGDTATVGNPWIIIWRDGQWRATTFSWLRPGQTSKTVDDVFFGGIAGSQTFRNFKPVAGQRYGFMVSGVARDMSLNNIRERSNIVTMTWPSGISPSCSNEGGEEEEETNPGTGNPFISGVTPSTAKPGATTITINGTDLTSTVQFFDGDGKSYTYTGNLNTEKTRVNILVPAEIPIGNATVKIWRGGTTPITSNGKLIKISNTLGGGGDVATVPSYNASSGWGGNLAHNTTDNTWLVVSAGTPQNGTYGRIMNNDGTTVGSQIVIASAHSGGPKVAYSKDMNKYLVVWLQWDDANRTSVSEVRGRFINPNGTFSGSEFLVHADTNYPNDASMAYSNSAMQYDSKNKKFVYVWQTQGTSQAPSRNSNLITISTTGVVGNRINLTSSFTKVATDDGRGDPVVAIKESTNEYCVIYQRGYSTGSKPNEIWNVSIRARTVNAVTGAIGPETVVYSESSRDATVVLMSIVYNTVNNKYLVGWSGPGGVKGKFMTSCNGGTAGSTITLNSMSSGHSLAYNPRSNQYASIGQNQDNSGNTYVILNSNGTKVSGGVAFAGGFGNFSPTIAANSVDGTFAGTSSLEYGVTRFAPNLGNKVASTNTISVPKYLDLGLGAFPDVAWYQNRLYVAYRSGDNLAINLYSYDKDLGDKKTEKIFTLSTGAGGFPRLTVSNNTLWVAYRDGEASGQDIKLWRKDLNTTESLGPGIGNDPVALGNGYIAWQKCEGTNCVDSKVYRRALASGSATFIRNSLPTGIARVLANGSVVMIDTDRTAVTWGLNSWYAGDLTVVTDITPKDDNGVAARFGNVPSTEFNLWLNQRAHTPHAATDGAGNYAVATWNPTVRIATFTKQ